jgi:two-component system cell cycle response regulator DivK
MTNPFALIIEDDPRLAHIFAEALRIAEFEVEIVQDGKAALGRLAATTPTVVVLDLHLPHLSGADILTQIRADQRLAETRVIVATADAMRAEPLRNKADLVLLKPISFHQLTTLARRLRPAGPHAEGEGS